MNTPCMAFERWLDEGRPATSTIEHEAHAAGCARCGALLELERALVSPAMAPAPAGFADAVLARIHEAPRRAARPAAAPGRLQVLLDPAIALALTLLALAIAERPLLVATVQRFASGWSRMALASEASGALAGAWRPFTGLSADPTLAAAAIVAITPALLLASWALFRWADRMVSGRSQRVFA